MEKKECYVPFSWKLWGLIFRSRLDEVGAWIHWEDRTDEPAEDEPYVPYVNKLYDRWFANGGHQFLWMWANERLRTAWYGVKFHGDGSVGTPDHGSFRCDMDLIRSLSAEVSRIASQGATFRWEETYLLSDVARDFALASEILEWRTVHHERLWDIDKDGFAALFELVNDRCVDYRRREWVAERNEYDPYKGERSPLDVTTLMAMLVRLTPLDEDSDLPLILYDCKNYALTPRLVEHPRGGTVTVNPVSFFCLVLVAQSFLSQYLGTDAASRGADSVFWTEGAVDRPDLEGATLTQPDIPGSDDEKRMFELMMHRSTFLTLPDGVGERFQEIRLANMDSVYGPQPGAEQHCGCPYWGDLVEGDRDVNIFSVDYESYIDDVVGRGGDDLHSRLVSYLSFLDAENRFLMLNRTRIAAHPLASISMKLVREVLDEIPRYEEEASHLYARKSPSDKEVARVMNGFGHAYAQYDMVNWILRYRDPSVAQVLDRIVTVNLRVASYIRDRMISEGIAGSRTAVTTYKETGGTLDPETKEKLDELCDENGLFRGTKVAAAKALLECCIVEPKQKGVNKWREYFEEIVPDVEEFIRMGREAPGVKMKLNDDGLREVLDEKKFDCHKLKGGLAFRCKVDGKEQGLTFKKIRRAITDMRVDSNHKDTRFEWILDLLDVYRRKCHEEDQRLARLTPSTPKEVKPMC